MKIAIAIIHGMGADSHGFSHPLQRGIAKAFTRLKLAHRWDDLIFQEILWADLLSPTQALLYQRINQKYSLRYQRLRHFFIEYLGDVIAYMNDESMSLVDSFRAQIFNRFEQSLLSFNQIDGFDSNKTPLVIIGHSLGSVVLLDYFNHVFQKGQQPAKALCEQLCGIVTLGSPLALWALQDKNLGKPPVFPGCHSPEVHHSLAKWLNIYDKDDVLAYPLKSINNQWNQTVSEDIAINVGGPLTSWNPFSHQGYWKNRNVHKQIAHLLATMVSN